MPRFSILMAQFGFRGEYSRVVIYLSVLHLWILNALSRRVSRKKAAAYCWRDETSRPSFEIYWNIYFHWNVNLQKSTYNYAVIYWLVIYYYIHYVFKMSKNICVIYLSLQILKKYAFIKKKRKKDRLFFTRINLFWISLN